MRGKLMFQTSFFDYQLPVASLSVYSKDYAKNNDLRILLEIATRSYLRMFTDSKNNIIHFVCKMKGQDCLDIEAHYKKDGTGYYFPKDCTKTQHKDNCAVEGTAFRYLEIYNLMKLKKELIESIMVESGLMNESPSFILSELSDDQSEYFFEKFIDGQVELRRRLRKRFDNVINIDIKKIGKNQEKEEKHQPVRSLPKLKVKLQNQLWEPAPVAVRARDKPEVKGNDSVAAGGDISYRRASNKIEDFVEDVLFSGPSRTELTDKMAIEESLIEALEDYESLKEAKRKVINKKNKKKKQIYKKTRNEAANAPQRVIRESIMILPGDSSGEGQQIFIESKEESLVELEVFKEQPEYFWSSSEQASENNLMQPFYAFDLNKQDYFKSLRNSTLKNSLQKESLTCLLFASESPKESI